MNTTDLLAELASRCACEVSLQINPHRSYHETASEWIEKARDRRACPPECTEEVCTEMMARDTVIELQFYPMTPIGFESLWHYDLRQILLDALATFDDAPEHQPPKPSPRNPEGAQKVANG